MLRSLLIIAILSSFFLEAKGPVKCHRSYVDIDNLATVALELYALRKQLPIAEALPAITNLMFGRSEMGFQIMTEKIIRKICRNHKLMADNKILFYTVVLGEFDRYVTNTPLPQKKVKQYSKYTPPSQPSRGRLGFILKIAAIVGSVILVLVLIEHLISQHEQIQELRSMLGVEQEEGEAQNNQCRAIMREIAPGIRVMQLLPPSQQNLPGPQAQHSLPGRRPPLQPTDGPATPPRIQAAAIPLDELLPASGMPAPEPPQPPPQPPSFTQRLWGTIGSALSSIPGVSYIQKDVDPMARARSRAQRRYAENDDWESQRTAQRSEFFELELLKSMTGPEQNLFGDKIARHMDSLSNQKVVELAENIGYLDIPLRTSPSTQIFLLNYLQTILGPSFRARNP